MDRDRFRRGRAARPDGDLPASRRHRRAGRPHRGGDRTMTISAEQRALFERDGYVVVPGMFDAAAVADLTRWTSELLDAPEVPGRHMVYGEPSLRDQKTRLVQRIENFCPYHEGFDGLLNGKLLDDTASLFGET